MTSTDARLRLPDAIVDALEIARRDTGIGWRATRGTKHIKIFLGPLLVGVCSKGSKRQERFRANLNIVADIRRKARELTQRQPSSVKGE